MFVQRLCHAFALTQTLCFSRSGVTDREQSYPTLLEKHLVFHSSFSPQPDSSLSTREEPLHTSNTVFEGVWLICWLVLDAFPLQTHQNKQQNDGHSYNKGKDMTHFNTELTNCNPKSHKYIYHRLLVSCKQNKTGCDWICPTFGFQTLAKCYMGLNLVRTVW